MALASSNRAVSLRLDAHRQVRHSARLLDATLWSATGESPELVVARHVPAAVSRRVLFELDIACVDRRAAEPVLAFDYGDGFEESGAVTFTPSPRSPKPWCALVDLKATPQRIRVGAGCGAGLFLASELRATPLDATHRDAGPLRLGAIGHLSRAELWPELAQYLGNIAGLQRLYLCVDTKLPRDVENDIRVRYPEAALLHAGKAEAAAASLGLVHLAIDHGVELVCLVHDRPSAHIRGADAGRWDMAHKLMGSGAIVESIIAAFAADPTLGIVVPSGHLLPAAPGEAHPSIAGAVCWARTEALRAELPIEDAPAEAAARGFATVETRVPDSATLTALELASPEMLGALRARVATSAAAESPLLLTPLAGLEAVDTQRGAWRAVHNDPQFILEGLVEHAGGWVAITLAQQTRFAAVLPTIHFDFGDGWTHDSAAVLRRAEADGRELETLCFIPPGVRRARFDPIAFPGRFTITRIAVRPLLAMEAAALLAQALGETGETPLALARLFPAYREWLDRFDTSYAHWLTRYEDADLSRLRAEGASWHDPPLISIFATADESGGAEPLMASLRAQVYPHWEVLHAPGTGESLATGFNAALAKARGRFFALVESGDALHPAALHHVARAAIEATDAALIYTDEDRMDADGSRRDPLFKCEPNAELLLACDMFSSLACYATDTLRAVGGLREGFEGAERHELALRVVEAVDRTQVIHLPRVLYHRRARTKEEIPASAIDSARRAIAAHLQRSGMAAEVGPAPGAPPGKMRVRFAVADPAPTVAIVIPTRDHADLLRTCVDSVRERTTYCAYSIVIVDNGSREPEAIELIAAYERDGIAVLRDDSQFNYAALNNRAVAASDAQFVCLLNNDIEVVSPDWLSEMVGMADRPGVGAVGARLWYPDRTLQHGGIVIGIAGYAGHAHRHLPQGAPGYADRAVVHQQFTAVTGACLLVRKAAYEAVGGLDEKLPVAYNDVDFCLRLFDAGYRNVWTPYAELVHHESATRGAESTPEKVQRLQADMKLLRDRWGARLFDDPAYSPNLTLDAEDFSLAWPPRVDDSP